SGQVRNVAHPTAPLTRGATWGANDQILFSSLPLSFAIYAVSALGGEPRQVTFPAENEKHEYPQFLPDGKRFLFSVDSGSTGKMELRLGAIGRRETRSLGTIAGNAAPAGPGLLLFRRAETLYAQRVNKQRLSFIGDPMPLVDGIRYFA